MKGRADLPLTPSNPCLPDSKYRTESRHIIRQESYFCSLGAKVILLIKQQVLCWFDYTSKLDKKIDGIFPKTVYVLCGITACFFFAVRKNGTGTKPLWILMVELQIC